MSCCQNTSYEDVLVVGIGTVLSFRRIVTPLASFGRFGGAKSGLPIGSLEVDFNGGSVCLTLTLVTFLVAVLVIWRFLNGKDLRILGLTQIG